MRTLIETEKGNWSLSESAMMKMSKMAKELSVSLADLVVFYITKTSNKGA
jgi:hypothetical protein